MANHPTKSRQMPPKKRELYTPEPVRTQVIARHMNGQSNRLIAREEGIDRETVGRILSHQEAVQMIARQRCRLQSLADKALDVIEQSLSGDDPRMAVPVAMKIIEHALPKGNLEQPLGISPEAQQHDLRISILAEIIEGSIYKDELFGRPLDPKMEQMKKELDRRMELEGGRSDG